MKGLSGWAIVCVLFCLVLSACGGGTEKIQVATDANWPPFEMLDPQSNQIVGFDIDLMNAIAAKEGLQVEYVNIAFGALMAGMAQCQYDAAISVITITDERKKDMLFSEPYFVTGQVLTVQADNTDISSVADLPGKVVGAQVDTTGLDEANKITGATINTYDDINQAFGDLMSGQLNAVIVDQPLALVYVNQNADKLKIVGNVLTVEPYGIAVCKTNTRLLEKINEGLAAIQAEGLIADLEQKWFGGAVK